MTNSDNGNRPRTAAHHPGDRVRVKHNLRHDHHSYSVEQNRARQALAGQIGSIRERAPSGAYRVAPPGSTFARAVWFEADELEPVASHAVGDRVKVAHRPELDRQFSTPSGAFARRRNDGYKGKITAESCGLFEVDTSGPERAWFDPSELEPVAEPVAVAPDPLALASRQAEEALQAADRWRAEYQTAKDELGAVQLALGETQREAKDARQEAREAKDALRAAEAERDALRARLVAASAAWASCRTWWSPASEAERAALDAVDAMLGAPGVTKIAGPWQDGRDGLRWRPRGDEPTRSAATVGSSGWTSFASPPAGGPEAGGEGESRADRALLAAGWTLEGAPAPVDDAQALRTACEAVTGTVGLPAPELASALLATVAAELEVGREERDARAPGS